MKGTRSRLALAAIAATLLLGSTLGTQAAYAAESTITGSWIAGTDEGLQTPIALQWIVDAVPTEGGTSAEFPDGFHIVVQLAPGHAVDGMVTQLNDQHGTVIEPTRFTVTPAPTGFTIDFLSLSADERPIITFNTYITDSALSEYSATATFTDHGVVGGSETFTVERTLPTGVNDYGFTGVVFLDLNENGVHDADELGYAGNAELLLTDSTRDLTFTTTADGRFSSNDAALSAVDLTSKLTLTVPAGYRATTSTTVDTFPTDADGFILSTSPDHRFGIVPASGTTATPDESVTPAQVTELAHTGPITKGAVAIALMVLPLGLTFLLLSVRRRELEEVNPNT